MILLAATAFSMAEGAEPAKSTPSAAESSAPAGAAAANAETWTVLRVGGDMEAEASFDAEKGHWTSGPCTIDTALPVGYPAPTPPGAIELKKYPSVRRAEITSTSSDTGSGFWPLFRHIERNEIAMTSPVEYDYPGVDPSAPRVGEWTMAFLYRTPELRETGTDEKDSRVAVVDSEPLLVVSLGGRGNYSTARVEGDIATLNAWLQANPEWRAAGAPRALMYNGPTLLQGRKWLEVQIPVERVDPASATPAKDATASAG
jgi:hypothetical protein